VRAAIASLLLLASAAPQRAEATYSILAADPERGVFGAAVASCVPLEVVTLVYGATPSDAQKRGAVITQSVLLPGANEQAIAALAEGTSADDVLAALIDPAFDAEFELRQLAVVDAAGDLAVFTGADNYAFAAHRTFEVDGLVASAQGNFLTGPEVLEAAEQAFGAAAYCGVAERLLRALAAAGAEGRGDARCTPDGGPALAATLSLDPPGEAPLRLSVEVAPGEDPAMLLRMQLDAQAPDACTPPPEQGGGGAGGGSPGEPTPTGLGDSGCTHAPLGPRRWGSVTPVALLALALALAVCRRRTQRSVGHDPDATANLHAPSLVSSQGLLTSPVALEREDQANPSVLDLALPPALGHGANHRRAPRSDAWCSGHQADLRASP
jgi:uncharacterized Ntn-hydrolase superfamily protein